MKRFRCDSCQETVYFENTSCLKCGSTLAFLPDRLGVHTVTQNGGVEWLCPFGKRYQLCQNRTRYHVCNWAVAKEDNNSLCASCRLNSVIPNLNFPSNKTAWEKFEAAKRRLNYSLLALGLRLISKREDSAHGLSYEFRVDAPGQPAFTGHQAGTITFNLAEADDVERERTRVALAEPTRTLLGHFRHEVGHYFWERFIKDTPQQNSFRDLFGDERSDYQSALGRYYRWGPPSDWRDNFITAYATSHPWEDWAETWAHYLLIYDTLETAAASGLSLRAADFGSPCSLGASFQEMLRNWFPLTYLLNDLNRGLGLPDAYPFLLPPGVLAKLQCVHDSIACAGEPGKVVL